MEPDYVCFMGFARAEPEGKGSTPPGLDIKHDNTLDYSPIMDGYD